MSRSQAAGSVVDAETPSREPAPGARPPGLRGSRHPARQSLSSYFERALLLWPRLDRARIRKCAHEPERIAEIVARRTSQPYEVILAMLVRPAASSPPASPGDGATPERKRRGVARIGLRIVGDDGHATGERGRASDPLRA